MKRIFFAFGLVLCAFSSTAQVSDDLSWSPTTATSTATSPTFTLCDGSTVNYTITATNQDRFINVTAGGNGSLLNGIIIPSVTSIFQPAIPMNFTFTAPVCNLRIRFVDLDGIQGESISGISPTYSNLTGTYFDPTGLMNSVDATIDDATGWVEWTGSVTSVDFIYNRPGTGYGLSIDSVAFDCCNNCKCDHKVLVNSLGNVNTNGSQSINMGINSLGEAVSSICVELPFYVSSVEDECLRCDVANQELFGTIRGAQPIAGTPAVLYDPLGLGYSRKICWTFTTPTVVNQNIQLDLQFPPVLKLTCCKNKVNYCLDVTIRKPDCTFCEYTVCPYSPQPKTASNESQSGGSDATTGRYNDHMGENDLSIKPNPASTEIEVELKNSALSNGELTIYTATGALVKTMILNSEKTTIDVSRLEPGLYLLNVRNGELTSSKQFVVD